MRFSALLAPNGAEAPTTSPSTHLKQTITTVVVALCALSLSLLLFNAPGTPDVALWLRWMAATRLGVQAGYAANGADYPPLTTVILYGVAWVADALVIDRLVALKGALSLALVLTTGIFLAWTRRTVQAALLYFALLLNSVALGYLDIFFAPPLLLSLWALQAGRISLFGLFFSLACLIKWQPLILAPFVIVYFSQQAGLGVEALADWVGERRLFSLVGHPPKGSTPGSRAVEPYRAMVSKRLFAFWPVALVITFTLALFGSDVGASLARATSHPYLSGNALNLPWVITHWLRVAQPQVYGGLDDGLARYVIPNDPDLMLRLKLLCGAVYGVILIRFAHGRPTFLRLVWFALLGYLAYFTLNVGVHENHLFLAVVLAAAWVAEGGQTRLLIGLALALNVNLVMFYGLAGQGLAVSRVVGVDLALPLAILNVSLFVWLMVQTLRGARPLTRS